MQKIEHFSFRPIPEKEQTDLISVIVAVYNIEAYLEKCVRSIREQTYRNLQIILVDDGSTDGCPGLCDRLAGEDDRIQVIHKETAVFPMPEMQEPVRRWEATLLLWTGMTG